MDNRIWVRSGGQFKAVIESAESLEYTRRYSSSGDLLLRVRRKVDGARYLTNSIGDEISVVSNPEGGEPDLTFTIESTEFSLNTDGEDVVEVTGREAGMFNARITLPPPFELPMGSSSHHKINDNAETAMLEVVRRNVGPGAPSYRQYPGLVMASNFNRGKVQKYQTRFEVLEEKLTTWAEISGLGWEVKYDAMASHHEFRVLEGQDVSADVVFSLKMENLRGARWQEIGSDQVSVAYVAGQGKGTAREMAEVWNTGSQPSGTSRREMLVDARDLDSAQDLPQRGEERLAERSLEESFKVQVNEMTPFQYLVDYDLGDLVTIRNEEWGVTRVKQIVEVETILRDGKTQRSLTLGKAPKTLKGRVMGSIGDQSGTRQ